jgi:gliding motility-associated-like protein
VTKTYGTAITGGSGSKAFTTTGLQNGQTISSVTIAYGTGAAATANAGTYSGAVTPSAATGGTFIATDYTITYVSRNITVGQAALRITANNKTKVQGTTNPTLTVSYTGFVNGQTNTSLTTQPRVTTTATTSSPAGTYPITVSGAVGANYAITYVAGTLTVTASTGTLMVNASEISLMSVNSEDMPSIAPMEPVVKQAVSPNGDGINDVLVIENIESYPDNRVVLMNRNGNTIYEINGYNNSNKVFDGHSNITRAMEPPGTYYYMLEYKVKGELRHKTDFFVIKY